MSSENDESDCEVVSSQPSAPKMFDTVPESMDYQFKFIHNSRQIKLKYILKEGKTLPYSNTVTSRKGKEFRLTFSKTLTPTVEGYSEVIVEDDWHIFTKDVENSEVIDNNVQTSPAVLSPPPPRDDTSTDGSQVEDSEKNSVEDHPLEESDNTDVSSVPAVGSVHQNPKWLPHLKENFHEEIISACSSRTREAVKKNEYIECDKEYKRVKNEILYTVVCNLQKIFGRASRPGKSQMREIMVHLVLEYPEMFKSREETKEKRGVEKLDVQAQKLCDRYREKLRREAVPSQANKEDEEVPPVKKVKQRDVYGVTKEKWHKKKKATIQTLAALNRLESEREFTKREAVFEEHRDELCHEFRESRANINRICKPFFSDVRHLGHHFQYMTETPPLDDKIEQNFAKFIGYLEVFILNEDKSIETKTGLDNVELVCAVEYSGSTIFKDIHLLRLACQHFDGSTSTPLIRLESDSFEDDTSGSPHLLAVVVEKSIIFELWVENSKLLGNLSLGQGLAAFFHLCFCFDLKYPKGGQTVADLLQRQVCKYGDDTGTRTWKKKDAAEKKVDYFRAQICKLLL